MCVSCTDREKYKKYLAELDADPRVAADPGGGGQEEFDSDANLDTGSLPSA